MSTLAPAEFSSGTQLYPDPSQVDHAHSVDEAMYIVGRRLSQHRLTVQERHPRGLATLSTLDLGDVALASLRYGFNVEIDAGVIADYFMVKWAFSGQGQVMSGERTAATSTQTLVITSPTQRTGFRMTPSCAHLTVRVDRKAAEERLSQSLGRRLYQPLEFNLEVAIASDFGRAWCQLISHICQMSASVPAVLASEDVRKQYSRTLIELLIQSAPHNYSAALRARDVHASPWHVRRAQEFVEAHLAEIHSVEDIAASIGVTARTLQNGFKQALNMSPAEYVRRARVQALHRALLAANSDQSVTSLMLAVGIANFGRYAQYYRKLIGVPPSETLRRSHLSSRLRH